MIFRVELYNPRTRQWVDSGLRNALDDLWGSDALARADVDAERTRRGGYALQHENKTTACGWRVEKIR